MKHRTKQIVVPDSPFVVDLSCDDREELVITVRLKDGSIVNEFYALTPAETEPTPDGWLLIQGDSDTTRADLVELPTGVTRGELPATRTREKAPHDFGEFFPECKCYYCLLPPYPEKPITTFLVTDTEL
jgi:hypothetical protein